MKRQNDNVIKGEIWKLIPNTDFAYYSDHNRFCYGSYLVSENQLKLKVNYVANLDNIMKESEGYKNIDYYTKWRNQSG